MNILIYFFILSQQSGIGFYPATLLWNDRVFPLLF